MLRICSLFETGPHNIAQAGLELRAVLLPQPYEYWDHRCMLACPTGVCFLKCLIAYFLWPLFVLGFMYMEEKSILG